MDLFDAKPELTKRHGQKYEGELEVHFHTKQGNLLASPYKFQPCGDAGIELSELLPHTARIVDVKYYVLLPSVAYVGSSLDNYQWESLLRSVSAHRSYRWVYDAEYKPANVTDFLILNQRMPRSLAFCYRNIVDNLNRLADDYGARAEPHALAAFRLRKGPSPQPSPR